MKHMWDERGFFYYRVLRMGTIRISYMRWSQAWMLEALSTMLMTSNGELKAQLSPAGRPEQARVTVPVNPLTAVTLRARLPT